MRLFIAEKPSVAKAIAAVLGTTNKGQGFIECGSDTITWCFGHMFELAEPDEYTPEDVPRNKAGKKLWRTEELPIIPEEWVLNPKTDTKSQLNIIKKLVRQADSIVHAGDPDREGQLLVDDVLLHCDNNKPVSRFWVSAQDKVSIERGLNKLKNNDDYLGWAEAARGRQRADWLIGMNLSRAFTLRAERGGSRSVLTVGRVQTPTLNLVVMRDKEIENFKPKDFFKIEAEFSYKDSAFVAKWQPGDDQIGLDSENRLLDGTIADNLVSKLQGQAGVISKYEQKTKKQNQPLSLSLSDISLLASNKHGFTAEETLKVCQSLYETHKLTSYPRTDCSYLPESQHSDAPAILDALRHNMSAWTHFIDKADPQIKSKTWNDKKVTAHHGIIPTMNKADISQLSDKESKLYQLIVRAYLAQFYPLHEFLNTAVEIQIADENFATSGKVVTVNGWRDVYQDEDDDKNANDDQSLPAMANNQAVYCQNSFKKAAKTKAPSRYTEGSLMRAMKNIHKEIDDPEIRKILQDGDGIGTPATWASIVSELKRREFLAAKGKQIISTTLGRSLIAALPKVVTSPILTALYERVLKNIENDEAELLSFVSKQEEFIRTQVDKANDGSVKIAGGKKAPTVSTIHKCMSCGHGLTRRVSKKKGKFWWGCSNYPTCDQTYQDVKGRPNYQTGRTEKEKETAK